jgi:hypothetical protein
VADWVCGRCGGEAPDHARSDSTCVWEPIDTDWLAEHDRQVAEKATLTRSDAIDRLIAAFGEPPWDVSLAEAIAAIFPLSTSSNSRSLEEA